MGVIFLSESVSIFQIAYETEQQSLTICESQIDEFLDICQDKIKYRDGKVFHLEKLGKLPIDTTVEIIPYFYSEGILVNESLYLNLKDPLNSSGQWIKCNYGQVPYFYFKTSVVIDSIDYDASGCKYIDGYMVSINPIVFRDIDYGSINLFKIPRKEDGKSIWFFATESFKALIEQLNISNIKFVAPKI